MGNMTRNNTRLGLCPSGQLSFFCRPRGLIVEAVKGSGLFLWPPTWPDRGFEAKTDGTVLYPVVVAEGEAAAVAVAEGG